MREVTVKLRFVNSDATPKVAEVTCDAQSVPAIMAWYGAYFAGDRYYVEANGARIAKDRNGEPVEKAAIAALEG
jgi:hypothetical protein